MSASIPSTSAFSLTCSTSSPTSSPNQQTPHSPINTNTNTNINININTKPNPQTNLKARIALFITTLPTTCYNTYLTDQAKTHTRISLKAAKQWCAKTYHDHSDMVSQLSYFSLNTVILASKIFKQIPHIIHRGCYTALSFTSFMYMNIQLRDLEKNYKDLRHAIEAKDPEGFIVTAAKVTAKSLNFILTQALLAASLFSLFAYPQITLAMYAAMRPFSLFSLAIGIGSDVYDYNKSPPLISSLEMFKKHAKNSNEPEKIRQFAIHFLKRLYHEKNTAPKSNAKRLARHTFRQLDHYVIEDIEKKLKNKDLGERADQVINNLNQKEIFKLYDQLKKALALKREYKQAHLGLTVLGYTSVAICKIWPDTLVQSSVTWGISLLYTIKLIWKKYKHCVWSRSLTFNGNACNANIDVSNAEDSRNAANSKPQPYPLNSSSK